MRRLVLVCALAACGRIEFDPEPGDASVDSAMDGIVDSLLVDTGVSACRTNPAYVQLGALVHRYKTGPLTTWAIAKADCEADGAYLAIPDTADEASTLDTESDWIGITDEATDGVWVTVRGEVPAYLVFLPGQPDGGTTENCLRNNGTGYEDRDCTDARDYSCECD